MEFTNSGRKLEESTRLGPLEFAVLRILWSCPTPGTVRDVLSRIERPVAYTTILTTMDRLYQKGLLERSGQGREAFLYRPLLKQEQWQRNYVREFVIQCITRSPARESFLSGMIEALANHDEYLLEVLDQQIEIYRAGSRSGGAAGC